MKALFTRLPSIRWVPHDIPQPESSGKKEKEKSKRSLLLRKGSSSEPNHGALKRKQSVISLTSEVDEELDARTHVQAQSMFFAMLPIEIRKMVYEYVAGSATVHLTLGTKKRFGHFICEETSEEEGSLGCGCKVMVGGAQSHHLSSACLRMLLVCRRMYSEAARHLYAPHTFSLLHITHLLYLPTRTPQARLNSIRTLRLRWAIRALPYFRRRIDAKHPAYPEDTSNWEKGWDIISRMQDLRDLKVVITDPSPDGIWEGHWLAFEHMLLEPVKKVVKPKVFELVLPYQSCIVERDMGESKVRLIRPIAEEEQEDE